MKRRRSWYVDPTELADRGITHWKEGDELVIAYMYRVKIIGVDSDDDRMPIEFQPQTPTGRWAKRKTFYRRRGITTILRAEDLTK